MATIDPEESYNDFQTLTGLIEGGPWDTAVRSWNILVLGGESWPGIATIEIDRANKWDTKKSKGKHNSEREFSGADDAKVKITVLIWTVTHYEDLQPLLSKIEPNPGKKKPESFSIEHPVCALRNVQFITIDKISGPKQEGKGLWTLHIEATETKPPETRHATGTVKSGGKIAGGGDTLCKSECQRYRQLQEEYAKEYNEWVMANRRYQQALHDQNADTVKSTSTEVDVRKERVQVAQRAMEEQAARLKSYGCSEMPPAAEASGGGGSAQGNQQGELGLP